MTRIDDAAVFVAVVEQQGFSKAARLLGLPATTVSRRVQQLEARLGARLLNRTTRTLALTDSGGRYYEACAKGLEVIDAAERTVREAQNEPSGIVRISAPIAFGEAFFAGLVADFLHKNPRVSAELVLTDEQLDLVRMRIDVALRFGSMADSDLVARKLWPAHRLFCASPAYLAAHGTPLVPDDLRRHDCIISGAATSGETWALKGEDGPLHVPVRGRIAANVMSLSVSAAVAGLGIAQLPEAVAHDHLAAGRLVQVLEGYALNEGGLYVVFPGSRHVSAAVRAFVDHVGRWAGPRPPKIAPVANCHPADREAALA